MISIDATRERYYYDPNVERLVMTALQQQTHQTFPGIDGTLREDHGNFLGKSLGLDNSHGALIVKGSQEQFGMVMRLLNTGYFNEKAVLEYAFNSRTGQWEIRSQVWIHMHIQNQRPVEKLRIGKPRYPDVYYLAVFPGIKPDTNYYVQKAYNTGFTPPVEINNIFIEVGLARTLNIAGVY